MCLPAFVCLSEILRVDRCRDMDELIFEPDPDPDYSPDAGTGLLSPISPCYAEFYVGKIRRIRTCRCSETWF